MIDYICNPLGSCILEMTSNLWLHPLIHSAGISNVWSSSAEFRTFIGIWLVDNLSHFIGKSLNLVDTFIVTLLRHHALHLLSAAMQWYDLWLITFYNSLGFISASEAECVWGVPAYAKVFTCGSCLNVFWWGSIYVMNIKIHFENLKQPCLMRENSSHEPTRTDCVNITNKAQQNHVSFLWEIPVFSMLSGGYVLPQKLTLF